MSVQIQASEASRAKQAYVLLKTVEKLQVMPDGVNSDYGAEQCNRLLTAARELAASDPETLRSLDAIEPLSFEPGMDLWLAAEAKVFLAELNGILQAFVQFHMDPQDKKRVGL